MNVVLFGASGRIGQRIATELLDREHHVTGVSRGKTTEEVVDPNLESVTGDATDVDEVADLVSGHDAVASALGPSGTQDVSVLVEMAEALVEGMRRTNVARLVWTGGAGGLQVGPNTKHVETDEFSDEIGPDDLPDDVDPDSVPDDLATLAQTHIDTLDIIRDAEDLRWSYLAPAARITPGTRTGSYRTAAERLVVTEDGQSYISMEDFAIAFVDELERADAVHTQLGVGY